MNYVYLLRSQKNNFIYVGYASDLKDRLWKHNNLMVKSTKRYAPWELIYYEAYRDSKLVLQREARLKYFGKAYGQLKRRVGL